MYSRTFFRHELTAKGTFRDFRLETHKCLVTESSDQTRILFSLLFEIQIILKKSFLQIALLPSVTVVAER